MTPTQTPVFLADPHKDITPTSYVIQVTTSQCLSCGYIGQSCETFARTWLKGQWGKPYSNMRPLDKPKYRLPIERITRPTIQVPFCDHCQDPNKATTGLPYPPADKLSSVHVGASFAASPAAATPKPKTTKKLSTTTTDDLLKGLDL